MKVFKIDDDKYKILLDEQEYYDIQSALQLAHEYCCKREQLKKSNFVKCVEKLAKQSFKVQKALK